VTKIPREPDYYWPSTHAKQRRRDRGIQWEWVAHTIENGRVHPSVQDDCRVIMERIEDKNELLQVVANVESGEIVTVAWYE